MWTEWSECPECYKGEQPIIVQWADCGCQWFGSQQENMNCSCSGGEFVDAKPRFDICPETACPGMLCCLPALSVPIKYGHIKFISFWFIIDVMYINCIYLIPLNMLF